MQPVPRIFVSATSRDLKTARTLVSEGLRRMECLPIVQDDFPPDYKSVREMLVTKIKTCNAVVHLAGFYYGAEPQPLPADPERRSFTQMEYEISMELGLPCYVFLCGEKFPFDEHDPEPEEKRALQLAHRGRLLARDELFYEFETREDLNSRTRELQLSVEALRDELAQERKRRMMTMVVSAVALLVALVGGMALFSKSKDQEAVIEKTQDELSKQGEIIEMLLAEQARLRERGGADDIAAQAERNVAKQENLSPEEVRLAVSSAIAKAESEVAKAKGTAKADALKRLADAQMAAGLKNEATANYQRRLELLSRSEQPVEWAVTIATVADLLFSREYEDDGPKMVREAIAWAETSEALGPEHPATLRLKESLRQFVFIKGDNETAIAMGKELQEIWDRIKGEDSPESIHAAGYLGRHLRTDGQYDEAEAIFKRIIASCEELYGEDDIRTLDARWDLANSLVKQERFSEAEAIYKDILARAKKELGAGDSQVLALGAALAFLKEAEGNDAEGLLIWKSLLEDAEKYHEADSEEVQVYMDVVAIRELENENFEKAGDLYRKLYESRVRTLGENQLKTVNTLDRLALVYRKAGDQDRYIETMPKVIAGKIEALGADSLDIAQDQYDLSVTLSNEDMAQEAFVVISDAIALRKRVLGATDPRTLTALVMGQIIANQTKDWKLATKAGEEALAAFEERGDEFAESRASVLFRLALAHEMLEENEVALAYAIRSAKIAVDRLEKGHELHGILTAMIRRLK